MYHAEAIKKFRRFLKLSQVEFANKLGLKSRSIISHYEAGRKMPSQRIIINMVMLAKVYEYQLTYEMLIKMR